MSDMKAEDVLAASAGMMASLTERAQAAEARCADLQARCERLEGDLERLVETTNMLIAEVPDPGTEALAAVYCASITLQHTTEKAAPAGEG